MLNINRLPFCCQLLAASPRMGTMMATENLGGPTGLLDKQAPPAPGPRLFGPNALGPDSVRLRGYAPSFFRGLPGSLVLSHPRLASELRMSAPDHPADRKGVGGERCRPET